MTMTVSPAASPAAGKSTLAGTLLPAFDFQSLTRVIFGTGAMQRLGELTRELGGKPCNRATSRLLQAIASAGLQETVSVLGEVSYADLINLMRIAAVVIQPSRFEGWSTIVQDAKALGRPILCSDLPVHREQAPEALAFFSCDDVSLLANLLASRWDRLQPGPQVTLEELSLMREREFARQHGEKLLGLCQEICRPPQKKAGRQKDS
jgi:glycosyltransferase involved in cell wall biosynthesis